MARMVDTVRTWRTTQVVDGTLVKVVAWYGLAPVQARLVPVADRHLDYATMVANALSGAGLRVEVDSSSARMQAKVRNAQLAKVPYTLVLGDRDEQASQSSQANLTESY